MTEVLSVKVDKEKLKQLEEIAREEQSDRSTTARRLLDMGIKEWKVNKAVEMFGRGKLSLWRGADSAGLSLREFIEILDERKVAWVGVSARELEAEVKAIENENTLKVKFVFDASSLIHLTKAGLSPLIVTLQGEKYTVPAVFDEVVRKGKEMDYPDAVGTASLVDEGALKVKACRRKEVIAISRIHKDIHAGESEVIVLAREMSAIAVIDDRVARAVAKIHGVRVEGSYGVILRAAARGSISKEEAEGALGGLVASGWRCDADLYAALLDALRETLGRQTTTDRG